MPVQIDGQVCYRAAEVCQIVGIGKSTLFHLNAGRPTEERITA